MLDISPNLVNTGILFHIDPLSQACYSPNVFPFPTDLFRHTPFTTGSSGTLSRDTITTPVGSTPLKYTITGGDPYTGGYGGATGALAPASTGETWTLSYYVKGSVVATSEINMGFSDASYNVQGGVSNNFTMDSTWTRRSVTFTTANALIAWVSPRIDSYLNTFPSTAWYDGYQVEKSPVVTRFNPNYYGPSVVKDLGARKIDCTLFGRPIFSDLNGGSIELLAANSQYLESNKTILKNTDNFTISTWINFSTVPTNSGIIQHGKDGFGSGWGAVISMGANTSQVIASIVTNTANRQITYNAPSALLANTWYNFTLSYQQGVGTALYLNGALIGSASFSDIGLRASTKGLMIGNNIGTSPGFTSEKFGHTLVYDRSLTAAEISQNFNALRRRYGI